MLHFDGCRPLTKLYRQRHSGCIVGPAESACLFQSDLNIDIYTPGSVEMWRVVHSDSTHPIRLFVPVVATTRKRLTE